MTKSADPPPSPPFQAGEKRAIGVYVHWPYCARVCPYCDFNVYKTREIDAERWRRALASDLERWRAQTGARQLGSLYFGGGTPSLAPLPVIEGVIETCGDLWGFESAAEITLESNPTDAEEGHFADLKVAGVNRLSLGVQAFDDPSLRFLGRNHSAAEARRALASALGVFENVAFDLIYALPGETAASWRARLQEALSFGAPHLSLYQLTIEDGTAFANAVARGAWSPSSDDIAAELFDIAQELPHAAGLSAYEVSNHARPGRESRHNQLYWRHQDYAGVGPGAHGRLKTATAHLAAETHRDPERYLRAVEQKGSGRSAEESLDRRAVLTERLSMGLRLEEGIDLNPDDLALIDPDGRRVRSLVADGLLVRRGARLQATRDGRRVLNAVTAALLI
jgi:oxygen-independent coproporphyrinogen-3 oxidase